MSRIGAVAIGRNEGERLQRCLRSLMSRLGRVVYVDSGSTDGSVELARTLGAEVVELDMSVPFSAARARNAGFEHLKASGEPPTLVQFIDGDCELVDGWLERAAETFEQRADAAIVCGRLRELFPDASIYNRLCDLEWNTPVGELEQTGGIFMIRARAFERVGGFDPNVVAGEEPELCLRLRQAGWKVLRIDAEMARHDAAMYRFAQWWMRMVRGGLGCAQSMDMHGRSRSRFGLRESVSMLAYGVVGPLVALALVWPTWGLSVPAMLLLYGMQVARVSRHFRRRGWSPRDAWLYAGACIMAKLPQSEGQIRYWWNRCWGRGPQIIEHKASEEGAAN